MRPWTEVWWRRARRPLELLQWGHGLAAVDGCSPTPSPPTLQSFNGATALRPWTGDMVDSADRAWELQWGHGLAAVDGACGPSAKIGCGLASMGPRPCGRGRLPALACRRVYARASMGPRPCGRGRAGPPLAKSVRSEGFNGATALRPWTAAACHLSAKRAAASMGPRPCGRGRSSRTGCTGSTWTCFNGATALRPWTARPHGRRGAHAPASMGPRPCGRGRRSTPLFF